MPQFRAASQSSIKQRTDEIAAARFAWQSREAQLRISSFFSSLPVCVAFFSFMDPQLASPIIGHEKNAHRQRCRQSCVRMR